MLGFKQFLLEGAGNVLFHATTIQAVDKILSSNILKATRIYRQVSMTRSFYFAQRWRFSSKATRAIIEIDRNALQSQYKIKPDNYFYHPSRVGVPARPGQEEGGDIVFAYKTNASEELVSGDIENIRRYIKRIFVYTTPKHIGRYPSLAAFPNVVFHNDTEDDVESKKLKNKLSVLKRFEGY